VLSLGLGFTVLIAGLQIQGTSSIPGFGGDSGDSVQKYDFSSSVTVSSTGTGVEFSRSTYEQSITESGLFGGLSFSRSIGDIQASLITAESVRVKYFLNGPVTRNISQVDELGDIRRLADSKESSFNAKNLPCGNYVLHMNLVTSQGEQDYFKRNVDIQCESSGGGE
jgi:hypothetical protein